MFAWLKSGSPLLVTVASIGEICAVCTAAWAFFFPDQAAEKWAQFQQKIEAAQEELGLINDNLEIANGIAAATEISNRAIEASNRAIEASANVIAATNLIIAEQAARQTAAQEGTNLNTAVLANESNRLSSLAEGLKLGILINEFNGAIEMLFFVGNSTTRGLSNLQGDYRAADNTLLTSTVLGVVNRNDEVGQNVRIPIDSISDSDALSRIIACLNGKVEGDENEFYLQAELVTEKIDAVFSGEGIELVMRERPVITDAPSETCAS